MGRRGAGLAGERVGVSDRGSLAPAGMSVQKMPTSVRNVPSGLHRRRCHNGDTCISDGGCSLPRSWSIGCASPNRSCILPASGWIRRKNAHSEAHRISVGPARFRGPVTERFRLIRRGVSQVTRLARACRTGHNSLAHMSATHAGWLARHPSENTGRARGILPYVWISLPAAPWRRLFQQRRSRWWSRALRLRIPPTRVPHGPR